jgi:hypothetical protein
MLQLNFHSQLLLSILLNLWYCAAFFQPLSVTFLFIVRATILLFVFITCFFILCFIVIYSLAVFKRLKIIGIFFTFVLLVFHIFIKPIWHFCVLFKLNSYSIFNFIHNFWLLTLNLCFMLQVLILVPTNHLFFYFTSSVTQQIIYCIFYFSIIFILLFSLDSYISVI